MHHEAQWIAPAPFWGPSPDVDDAGRAAMRRPTILRFATDAFMDDFHRTLETDPAKLKEFEAQFETWEGPVAQAAGVQVAERSSTSLERKLTRMRTTADRKLAMFGLSSKGNVGLLDKAPPSPAKGAANRRLKLYQPAHQRFYLVAADLVCRLPGLPDRALNAARQERVRFVVRRLRSARDNAGNVTRTEYAFVPVANGGTWQKVTDAGRALAAKEETLPLFSVDFRDDANDRRRVMAGLIPVARREAYVGAAEAATPAALKPEEASGDDLTDPGAPPPPIDPRVVLLSAKVLEPWKSVVLRAYRTGATVSEEIATAKDSTQNPVKTVRESREMIQVISWYVLLDFANFLQTYLGDVYAAITGAGPSTLDDPRQQALLTALTNTTGIALTADDENTTSLRQIPTKSNLKAALADILTYSDDLETTLGSFSRQNPSTPGWPPFLFALADADCNGTVQAVQPAATPPSTLKSTTVPSTIVQRKISALGKLVADALLAPVATDPIPDLPLAAQSVMAPDETAVFIIRCVFERPECGPIDPPLLSDPSREFEMAGFFDPEAPARPIRISLPTDTTTAGFRRAPKNTAFMVSDMLCGQINRAKGMGFIDLVRAVLPFPLHKDLDADAPAPCQNDAGASLGMICSLSIPIITICALILLIIIVSLLDIIFRWMPYFFFCFPLPKFNAKPPDLEAL